MNQTSLWKNLECGCIPKILGYESIDCNITEDDIVKRVNCATKMIYADTEFSDESKGQLELKIRYAKIILKGYINNAIPEGMTATHNCENLTTVRYLLSNIKRRRTIIRELGHDKISSTTVLMNNNTDAANDSKEADKEEAKSATPKSSCDMNMIDQYTNYLSETANINNFSHESNNQGKLEIIHHYPQDEQLVFQELAPMSNNHQMSQLNNQKTDDMSAYYEMVNAQSQASEEGDKVTRQRVFHSLVQNLIPGSEVIAPVKSSNESSECFKKKVSKIVSHHYRGNIPFVKVEWEGYRDLITTESLYDIMDAKEPIKKYLLSIGTKARNALLKKKPTLSECFK